ncbi:MAG: aldo/keto reductase [Elusimicrobiaceae bacterium]|nr:aldo/keto reductase [Elusimicrobiaceae bacterium]
MNKLKKILPKLAFGTWPISGAREWGAFDDIEVQKVLHALLENNITCIDTAAIYGLGGAENLLGKFFKDVPRKNFILTSKCGLLPNERAVKFDLSAVSLQTQIEDTLRRLNTDYLDIYFLHWPDKNTPLEETLIQMDKFRKEGKIRFIGLSNFTENLIRQAVKITKIDCLQNEFSLLNQENKKLFPLVKELDLAFMAYGVLNGGILSGKYNQAPNLAKTDVRSFFYKFYKGENFLKAQKVANLLKQIHQASMAQAAINFVLSFEEVTCAIFGAKTLKQLKENAGALSWKLTTEQKNLLCKNY